MLIDVHTHKKQNGWAIRSYHFSANEPMTLPNAPFSLGIHPWYADAENLADFSQFCLNNQKFLMAIGECGIDKIKGPDIFIQTNVFQKQIKLAAELQMPVIIHMVKSADLIYEAISKVSNIPFIIHGFNEPIEMVRQFKQPNVYFSLGESVFKNHNKNIKMLKEIPLHRLFFETDDSDISIKDIYQQFCNIRNISLSEIKPQIAENLNKVFSTDGTMD